MCFRSHLVNGNPFDLGSVWKIFSSWHTAHYRMPSAKYQPFSRELTSMGSASSSQLQCLVAGYCSIGFQPVPERVNPYRRAFVIWPPKLKPQIPQISQIRLLCPTYDVERPG